MTIQRILPWRIVVGFAMLAVQVLAVPPVANNDTNNVVVLSARAFISLPYTDPDGGTMSFTLMSGPSKGLLECMTNGQCSTVPAGSPVSVNQWNYTSTGTSTGTDSFAWQVCDGTATSATATMTINLTSNTPPVAGSQSTSLPVGSMQYFINLNMSHYDNMQPLYFTLKTPPGRGRLEYQTSIMSPYYPVPTNMPVSQVNMQTWFYTPSGTSTGTDSFAWQVNDGIATSATATVGITLTTNHPPVVNNQNLTLVRNDARKSLWLSGTDADTYQALTFIPASLPGHGVLEYQSGTNYMSITTNAAIPSQGWSYTPNTDYAGADSFQWRMSDGMATSGMATCSITINGNTPPVAGCVQAVCAPNSNVLVAAVYSDPDSGQTWTVQVVKNADHGSVTVNGSVLIYTPTNGFKGTDFFTYKVNDGLGDSNTALARIQVRAANERAGSLVLLVVDQLLFPNISNEVERLETDLMDEGYTSKVYQAATGIATSNLWAYLKSEYDHTNQWLAGTILIGHLPKAYVGGVHITDMVYWNMDTFLTNGIMGNLHIWVSRLYVDPNPDFVFGNEVGLIKRALNANHDCRKGLSRLPHTAYYYNAFSEQSEGCNGNSLLEVWPAVAITNEAAYNPGNGYSSSAQFLPWRTDIKTYAGADALVAGGDVFQESSHGLNDCYMNGDFKFTDLYRLIAQQRACILESCDVGHFGGIANNHVFTRGGGGIFAVGATESPIVGDYQIAKNLFYNTDAFAFRASLKAGETWGGALLKNYVFEAQDRTVYYGDLSLPVMVAPANELPVVTNLTASSATPCVGQPVTFSITVIDPDAALTNSPYVNFKHQVEWFMDGYNYGMNNPTYTTNSNFAAWTNQTHVFTNAGTHVVRAEVMDAWEARGWREISINVATQKLTSITVAPANAGVMTNATQQFTATANDQSGNALIGQPTFSWTVSGGTINASGLFTAGSSPGGPYTVTAASGGKTGTASVTVLNTGPQKMKLTFGGYTRNETLTNFPALVVLSNGMACGFAYCQVASPNGWDLRFKDCNESTNLNYELESWNTNGASYIWVQLPALTNNCSIWAYWGDTTLVLAPAVYTTNGATWDANYKGVWHLGQANALDSTACANNGTAHGNSTAVGLVGQAQSFTSNSFQYIDCGNNSSAQVVGNMTLSAWVKRSTTGAEQGFLSKYNGAAWSWCWSSGAASPYNRNGLWINGWQNANTDIPTGWTYITVSLASRVPAFYFNGQPDGTGTAYTRDQGTTANLCIGQRGDSKGYMNGLIDEARLEATARSSNWVWACWLTMASNSVFNSYGAAQPADSGVDAYGIPDAWKITYFGTVTGTGTGALDDPDGDSMNNLQEYLAGTCPTNAASRLEFKGVNVPSATNLVLRWSSVAGKFYALDRSTNLAQGFVFSVSSNIVATPDVNTRTIQVNHAMQEFFRVRVQP